MAKKKYISKHTGKEIDYAVDAILNTVGRPTSGDNSSEGNNGTLPSLDNMIKITWQELKDLRDSNSLRPGCWYRMTDYDGKIVDSQVYKSARHAFDILILAVSENELSEECRAARHEGDTYFPEDTNFGTWEIWYSLDNNKAGHTADWSENKIQYDLIDLDLSMLGLGVSSAYGIIANVDNYNDQTIPDYPYKISGWLPGYNVYMESFMNTLEGNGIGMVDISKLIPDMVEILGSNYLPIPYQNAQKMSKESATKGFIYRMIDERQNECGYDFKNILFRRYLITEINPDLIKQKYAQSITTATASNIVEKLGSEEAAEEAWAPYADKLSDAINNKLFTTDPTLGEVSEKEFWFYTFSSYDETTDTTLDISTYNPHVGYEGYPYTVKNNHIIGETLSQYNLDNNVFLHVVTYNANNVPVALHTFHDNYFTGTVSQNTFYAIGGHTWGNRVGSFCRGNVIMGGLCGNTINANFESNLICGSLSGSIIGNSFEGNIVAGSINNCNISANMTSNIIISSLINSTIGSYFKNNIFGNGISYCNFLPYTQGCAFLGNMQWCNLRGYGLVSLYKSTNSYITIEVGAHRLITSKNLDRCVVKGNVYGTDAKYVDLDELSFGAGSVIMKNKNNELRSINLAELYEGLMSMVPQGASELSLIEPNEEEINEEPLDIPEDNSKTKTSLSPNSRKSLF